MSDEMDIADLQALRGTLRALGEIFATGEAPAPALRMSAAACREAAQILDRMAARAE